MLHMHGPEAVSSLYDGIVEIERVGYLEQDTKLAANPRRNPTAGQPRSRSAPAVHRECGGSTATTDSETGARVCVLNVVDVPSTA